MLFATLSIGPNDSIQQRLVGGGKGGSGEYEWTHPNGFSNNLISDSSTKPPLIAGRKQPSKREGGTNQQLRP